MTLTKCYSGAGKRSLDHVCGDSLQRLRTPDHLPMDHSCSQARQQAMQQRQRRLTTTQNIRKSCTDSGNLREYSKKRFEFAVQNASVDRSRIGTVPRPSTTNAVSTANLNTQTGPTPVGSLLYNRIPLMLNSIRVRPHSETSKYNHVERTYPDIERTLKQSNCDFTVRSLMPHERCLTPRTNSMTPREYGIDSREIFITSGGHSLTSRGNSVTSRGQSRLSQSRYASSRCSGSDYILVPLEGRSDLYPNLREFLPLTNDDEIYADRWNTFTPRHQVVLEVSETQGRCDAMSESSSESASRPTPTRTTQPRPRPMQLTAGNTNTLNVMRLGTPLSGNKRTGSDQSMSGSMSSSISSISERPKCWVDDVTISSDVTEEAEDNVDITTPRIEEQNQKATPSLMFEKGKQKSKADLKQVKIEEKVDEQPNEEVLDKPMEEEEKEETEEVAEVDESPRDVFPNFLCPSSERKSRQAAIKMWLAGTSFTCADRNVPLL